MSEESFFRKDFLDFLEELVHLGISVPDMVDEYLVSRCHLVDHMTPKGQVEASKLPKTTRVLQEWHEFRDAWMVKDLSNLFSKDNCVRVLEMRTPCSPPDDFYDSEDPSEDSPTDRKIELGESKHE